MIVIESVTEAMIPAARRTVSGFRAANFARGCLTGVGLAVVVSGGVMAASSPDDRLRQAFKQKRIRSHAQRWRTEPLVGSAGGLAERGANPVVRAAGVQAGEELRE
jgi:hypothetical protein